MRGECDILIVGAGAAGLAAARALTTAPVETLVVEARDRVGGRAHTAMVGGFSVDLGCGWLHSADVNLFAQAAAGLGFELDKSPPHWTKQAFNADFSAARQAAFGRALGDLEDMIAAAAARGEDMPVSRLIAPGDPSNPLLDAFSSYYNGAEFDEISTIDYDAYQDSDVNWRAPDGYGALVAAYGAGIEVALETPVTRIDHSGSRISVDTPRGTISARAVILTVPTPLLAPERLALAPDLPALREAAAGLPLGLANKVFLSFDGPGDLPVEGHLFGDPDTTATGSYHLRPFGRPMIEVFLGGAHARKLEGAGPDAAAAFAIDELARLLGSDMRRRLGVLATTAWATEAWSRGSYSHAWPGQASARAKLAQPVDGRIFVAGEATSPTAFSTCHGAAETGIRAAHEALAALGVQKPRDK